MSFKKIKKSIPSLFQNPFFGSFFVVAVLFIFELAFLTPFFLINDDVFSLFIAKGAGFVLNPDPHLFYNNVLLGFLLNGLYTHFPGVSWYGLLLISAQFLSFWALFYSLLLRTNDLFKYLLFTASFFLVDLYYFLQLNYTMTSILAFEGGIFLLSALFDDRTRPFWGKIISLGAICLLLSNLVRFEAFFFSALISLPFIFYNILEKKLKPRIITGFAVTALIILAGASFDNYFYKNPDWKEFSQYIHTACRDRYWTDFEYNEKTKVFFDEAGWSSNDLKMFINWYFLDQSKFNRQNVEKLAQHFTHKKIDLSKDFFPIFSRHNSIIAILCFFTFLLFCPPKRIFFILANAAWVVGLMIFLAYSAVVPERLFVPAFSFLVGLTMYYAISPRVIFSLKAVRSLKWLNKLSLLFLALLLILIIPTVYRFLFTDFQHKKRSEEIKSALNQLSPKGNQLYVIWDSSFPYEAMDALDNFEFFRKFHIFSLSSFELSPLAQGMLSHFKIKNPLYEMVNNPNIYLICFDMHGEMYYQYMLEKYHIQIYPIMTFGCPYFNVFSIHSRERKMSPLKS